MRIVIHQFNPGKAPASLGHQSIARGLPHRFLLWVSNSKLARIIIA
jgi:hypothetical protein